MKKEMNRKKFLRVEKVLGCNSFVYRRITKGRRSNYNFGGATFENLMPKDNIVQKEESERATVSNPLYGHTAAKENVYQM